MTSPTQNAEAPLDRAATAWRAHPDGAHYRVLGRALVDLMETVILNATASGRLHGRGPTGVSWSFRVGAVGGRSLLIDHPELDLEDLAHELLARLLDRYLASPDFHVSGPAYLATGLVLLARTELRAAGRLVPIGDLILEAALPGRLDLDLVRACWFHRPGYGAGDIVPEAPGLSLRFVWASLCVRAGTSAARVAGDLGIHRSRLSALKRELGGLIPKLTTGGFLPLPPCRHVALGDAAARELGVAKAHPGLVRRPTAAEAPGLRARKWVLWRVLELAVTEAPPPRRQSVVDDTGTPIGELAWSPGVQLVLEKIQFTPQHGRTLVL